MQQSMQVGKPSEECEFEIIPFPGALTGQMKTTIRESGGTEPTGVIRTDQEWYVDVEWIIKGPLRHHLCGEFCLCVHIECIGPGLEDTLPCKYVEIDPCKPEGEWYKETITVPPGIIPGRECGQICEIAVTLISILPKCDPENPNEPKRPGHMAAYCKGPCVMFTHPPAE